MGLLTDFEFLFDLRLFFARISLLDWCSYTRQKRRKLDSA
jgi:hypothetical protein